MVYDTYNEVATGIINQQTYLGGAPHCSNPKKKIEPSMLTILMRKILSAFGDDSKTR